MSMHITLLAAKGDPIERLIVTAWDDLHQVLNPYAGIWGDHVYPRRLADDPTRVDPEWMDFAGSHYTAIVRSYQAYRRYSSIQSILLKMAGGDDSASLLVDLHDDVAAFWEHIGSGIDNLSAAWTDAPPLRVENAKEKEVAPDQSRLDWMYDRRSQFIHSRIIPKGIDGGMPFFNVRLFDDKRSSWASRVVREELVEDYYPAIWSEFLAECGNVWERLRTRLRDRDNGKSAVQSADVPVFDFRSVGANQIRVQSGPTPPSGIIWNIPPSGTR